MALETKGLLIEARKRDAKENAGETSEANRQRRDLITTHHFEGVGALVIDTDERPIDSLDLVTDCFQGMRELSKAEETSLR